MAFSSWGSRWASQSSLVRGTRTSGCSPMSSMGEPSARKTPLPGIRAEVPSTRDQPEVQMPQPGVGFARVLLKIPSQMCAFADFEVF